MTAPTIRRARSSDAAALSALKLATFRETFLEGFGIPYPPADLMVFERATYGEDAVSSELADPAKATWVAETAGDLVGYAQVGPCKLPHPEVAASQGELYQLYCARGGQGRGLGRSLLALVIDHLSVERPGPVWLGVWSGNHKAQHFYQTAGFRHVGDYRFPVGSWQDEEYIMRRDG